jgi:hypothetical protein
MEMYYWYKELTNIPQKKKSFYKELIGIIIFCGCLYGFLFQYLPRVI